MWKKSFKQTIKGPIWKYTVGSLSAGLAVLLIGKNFFNMTIEKSVILGICLFIALFILRYAYYVLINTIIYIHNAYVDSIWGKAIVDLKDAYSEIHFIRNKERFDDKEFVETMIIFCDTLKIIFDRKTKANCCVSIKVPTTEDEQLETLEVKNLCRDTHHTNRDTSQYMSIKHSIIGNTPYRKIVNKILKGNQKNLAYVNNDIEHTPDYDNTSIECYPDGILPYKSELVYPIIPIRSVNSNNMKMKGFICIDCDQKDKFDENRYDIPMVQGIADGLYDLFVKRNNNRNHG